VNNWVGKVSVHKSKSQGSKCHARNHASAKTESKNASAKHDMMHRLIVNHHQ